MGAGKSKSNLKTLNFSILVLSYFMWIAALDLQLWCFSIISHNITSISYNYYTDVYSF